MTCAFVPCPFIVGAEFLPRPPLAFELVTSVILHQLECFRRVFLNTMPTVRIEKKYTYNQTSGKLTLPYPVMRTAQPGDAWNKWVENGMIPYLPLVQTSPDLKYIAVCEPTFPERGNTNQDRVHSSIKVLSIHWIMHMYLNPRVWTEGQLVSFSHADAGFANNPPYLRKFPFATDYTGTTSSNIVRPISQPVNKQQVFHFRFLVVEFDEDVAIYPAKLLNWFYSTFTMYKSHTHVPSLPTPSVQPTAANTTPPPVSVQAKVMRITTPWVGKFNILADKQFCLSSSSPMQKIDLKIPINKTFKFDDDQFFTDLGVNYLLYPHIYAFILPPLSYETDFGYWDAIQLQQAEQNSCTMDAHYIDLCNYHSWAKLKFVDI